MHYNNTVIAITDKNSKPLRELEAEKTPSGRKCSIFLPFDSEYKFLIKNNSSVRIKLDIEIDGSNVTDTGVIIDGNKTSYIERFVNSAKCFKFVKATHSDVSDPTNKENGIIRIRCATEDLGFNHLVFYPHNSFNRTNDWYNQNDVLYGSNITCRSDNSDVKYSKSLYYTEAGATVEGSNSKQTFGTTIWAGDKDVFDFTFLLSGMTAQIDKEYQEYLRLKSKYG